ncbi:MAG: DUF4404 family protein [Myxococcota bacterium]|nr:DUF4404 family protein [Myxococcota bacterium]
MAPDRTRKLHEAVSALVERLRSDEEGIDRALPELEQLHEELGGLLEQAAAPPSSLGKRLRATLDRFESRHPRTTMMVGRIAESLSEMGL